jgi:hypothetical protein
MEFQQASIALLASMVLVLAGMVGWLYWQQTKIFQNMNNIVSVIGELAQRPTQITFPEPTKPEPVEEEDDRVTVEDEGIPEVPVVDGPPAHLDTDALEDKTKKELQDILVKRGIPYSKSDTKGALISLLKATS